jgi:hypothetical protein
MARLAGMTLRERWSGWKREPFTSDSTKHVSVWEKTRSSVAGEVSRDSRGDVDRKERVVYVRRSFTRGEFKIPKTEASMAAVPLQARALDALERIQGSNGSPLLFPGERGGCLDIHHIRPIQWRPAQNAAGQRRPPT